MTPSDIPEKLNEDPISPFGLGWNACVDHMLRAKAQAEAMQQVPTAPEGYRHELVKIGSQAASELERYKEALEKIEDFTNGYGDVAGIVCKLAAKALRPETAA